MRTLVVGVTLTALMATPALVQTDRVEISLALDEADLTAVVWGSGETIVAIPGAGADVAWFELLGPIVGS